MAQSFQDFFVDVCTGAGSPTLALAGRCGETGGGTMNGDISGDSEISLNPTQGLAMNQSALARAAATSERAKDRMQELRENGAAAAGPSPWSLLLNGRWEGLERDPTGPERGWDGDAWSAQLGADYRVSDRAVVGAILDFGWADYEFDQDAFSAGLFFPPSNPGDGESDSYTITLFGTYNISPELWIDGHFGGGYSDYEFKRRATFQESTRNQAMFPAVPVVATAETDGGEVNVGVGTGYDGSFGALSVGGYLRLDYAWTTVNGYREKDVSGLQMRVGGQDQDSLVSVVGLRASYAISTPIGVLLPQARIESEYEFLRDRQTIETQYVQDATGTVFRLRGDKPDRYYGNAGASVVMVLADGWMPFVDYEALFAHNYLDRHRVTLGLRKEL
jgi:outer membrane autotransporter protein